MTQIAGVTKGRGREMTALEAAIVDEHTRDKLYKFAFNKTRHPQDAEDLTQSTVEAALKKDAKGDADAWKGEPPPVMTWLGSLLNGALANLRRARRRKPTVEAEIEEVPSAKPDAELEVLQLQEERERDEKREAVKAELRAHFAKATDGHLALEMIAALEEGVKGGKGIAKRLGCSVPEANAVRKRIKLRLQRMNEERAAGGAPS
jgi:DNA-directed RNA polymerase specialized sigma24 family protein